MLFGYPIAATSNNWLHECICELLFAIHKLIVDKVGLPNWPELIPVRYQDRLVSRRRLQDHLTKYYQSVKCLKKDELALLDLSVGEQNCIDGLLSGNSRCSRLADFPDRVREPLGDLFDYAFYLLSPLEIRGELYRTLYRKTSHVCPFCGTESFDSPEAHQEPLDHYLARCIYPFAAVNLRNLVPMGAKCNSSYKRSTDLLVSPQGKSRIAIDPYNHSGLTVNLDQSQLFARDHETMPKWVVRFEPDSPGVRTWDEVFSISNRYARDHLDDQYNACLKRFSECARSSSRHASPESQIEILAMLEDSYKLEWLDRGFLKSAVFRLLRLNCEARNDRLVADLGELARPIPRRPAS
jgi:hypothetical protein